MDFTKSTLSDPAIALPTSASSVGYQVLGGGEVTLPALPQVSFGMEVSRHWIDAPIVGYEVGGVGFNVNAHWYVK